MKNYKNVQHNLYNNVQLRTTMHNIIVNSTSPNKLFYYFPYSATMQSKVPLTTNYYERAPIFHLQSHPTE